jgi:hypothetical protein
MKKNIIFSLIFAISFVLASCEKQFDTKPDGNIITSEQKKRIYELDPSKLSSEVNGMFGLMKAYSKGGYDDYQVDFGFPALASRLEHNGQDCVGDITGYNWFSGDQDYTNRNYTYRAPNVLWSLLYKQIRAANLIIAAIEPETEDPVLQKYLGQALAVRGYDYLYLVQIFQFTYNGHQNDLAVPIVLDDTPLEVISNNPRATVQSVYDQIKADLDQAIGLLAGKSISDKSQINQGVAYGIRARMNLVMQNWSDAASDASNALSVSGENPMSITDVSVPTFDDATAPGIMWGCIITPEDDVVQTGICNFTSMFTSLCFGYGGYTTMVGTWKKISILLYDQIPTTDVRKGWWLDENCESTTMQVYENSGEAEDAFATWNEEPYLPEYGPIWAAMGLEPYTNVKFAPNNKLLTDPDNASDFPLMRAEEMKLIQAEATGMVNLAAGKTLLQEFVTAYRDPSFVSEATTSEEFQNEVWLQRRIEFWGEGLSWLDIMRLKKPIIRKDLNTSETNFGALAIFNIQPETHCMLWPIPQTEIQSNLGIPEEANNQMGTLPVSDPVKKAYVNSNRFKKKSSIGYRYYQN